MLIENISPRTSHSLSIEVQRQKSIRKLSLKNLSFFGLYNSLYRENVLLSAHESPEHPGRSASYCTRNKYYNLTYQE